MSIQRKFFCLIIIALTSVFSYAMDDGRDDKGVFKGESETAPLETHRLSELDRILTTSPLCFKDLTTLHQALEKGSDEKRAFEQKVLNHFRSVGTWNFMDIVEFQTICLQSDCSNVITSITETICNLLTNRSFELNLRFAYLKLLIDKNPELEKFPEINASVETAYLGNASNVNGLSITNLVEDSPKGRHTCVDQIIGSNIVHAQGHRGSGVSVGVTDIYLYSNLSHIKNLSAPLRKLWGQIQTESTQEELFDFFKTISQKFNFTNTDINHLTWIIHITSHPEFGIASEAENDAATYQFLDDDTFQNKNDKLTPVFNYYLEITPKRPDFVIVARSMALDSASFSDTLLKFKEAGVGVVLAAGNQKKEINSTYLEEYKFEVIRFLDQMDGWMIGAVATTYAKNHNLEESLFSLSNYPALSMQHHFLAAPGDNIQTLGVFGDEVVISGTSAAAPIIAGCAALVKGCFPWMNSREVFNLLKATARKENFMGQFLDHRFGQGVVNVAKAISEGAKKSGKGSV